MGTHPRPGPPGAIGPGLDVDPMPAAYQGNAGSPAAPVYHGLTIPP